MKCSQSCGLCIIILISIFAKTYCELSLRNLNNFQKLSDTQNSWNSLPIMDNKLHKIVKKQMTVSDYLQTKKRKRSLMTDKTSFESIFKVTNRNEDKNNLRNVYYDDASKMQKSRLHQPYRNKREKTLLPKEKQAFYGRKEEGKDHCQEKPKNEERVEDTKNLEGRPCKHYVRFADKGDCHCFYECEVEMDGCMKFRHRRCPEGEVFAPEYLECLRVSYLKIIRRPKRNQPQSHKKMNFPDMLPEDPEPANEWLDASQGTNPKIPSEFKPKRKPKLRIYHLRCKRRLNRFLQKEPQKRHAPKPSATFRDTVKTHTFRRQHPRSFMVRLNKKDDSENKEKGNREKDNDDDDDNDEYDDDESDEEEDEDTDEETTSKQTDKKEEPPTPNDSSKTIYKSSNPATTNNVKFDEGPSSYLNVDKPSYIRAKTKLLDDSPETSKKVLIDASIKVDSAISNALKNILSNSKEKSIARGTVSVLNDWN